MPAHIAIRPLVVRRVLPSSNGDCQSFGWYEVQTASWRSIADQLGIVDADLDCVRVSRARLDLTCCPFCRREAA